MSPIPSSHPSSFSLSIPLSFLLSFLLWVLLPLFLSPLLPLPFFPSLSPSLRIGFVLMGLVAVAMFLGFLFVPESYRWLLQHGYTKKAEASLGFFLRNPSLASLELEHLQWLTEMTPSGGVLPTYILSVSLCAC